MKVVPRPDKLDGFNQLLDLLEDSPEECVLFEDGRAPIVMLRLDDYQALKGVAELLSSSDSKQRLRDAIARHDARPTLRVVND